MLGLSTTGTTNTNQLHINIPDEWKGVELQITILPAPHKNCSSERETVQGIPVTFLKNSYLNSFSDFWKLEALFKKEAIRNALNSFAGKICDAFIESILSTANLTFYTDPGRKHLFAYTSPAFSKKYGDLNMLDALTALKMYGIDKLEETSEKGYSKL